MNPAYRPSSQISRDLQTLRNTPTPQIPDLTAMNTRLARLSAEAQVDPARRGELSDALADIRNAEIAIGQIGQRNSQINALDRELNESLALERNQRIQQADDALRQAISEYLHSALQTARALRRVLDQQHRSAATPGASANLQHLRINQFNLPSLMPQTWSGTLGESMQNGRMQFDATPDNGNSNIVDIKAA